MYCDNNPIMREDNSGYSWNLVMAGGGTLGAIWSFGGANSWNPLGWIVLGVATVGTISYAGYKYYSSKKKSKESEQDSSDSKDREIPEAGAPGSKQWNEAKKKIKEGRGKGINVKVRNEAEAEQLINESRPKLKRRPKYEEGGPKDSYEVHPIDNPYNMPHIKWKSWSNGKAKGADGHIFWD